LDSSRGMTMSVKERCIAMLDQLDERQLECALTVLGGLLDLAYYKPNDDTLKAIEEADNDELVGPFETVDELMRYLNADD